MAVTVNSLILNSSHNAEAHRFPRLQCQCLHVASGERTQISTTYPCIQLGMLDSFQKPSMAFVRLESGCDRILSADCPKSTATCRNGSKQVPVHCEVVLAPHSRVRVHDSFGGSPWQSVQMSIGAPPKVSQRADCTASRRSTQAQQASTASKHGKQTHGGPRGRRASRYTALRDHAYNIPCVLQSPRATLST